MGRPERIAVSMCLTCRVRSGIEWDVAFPGWHRRTVLSRDPFDGKRNAGESVKRHERACGLPKA